MPDNPSVLRKDAGEVRESVRTLGNARPRGNVPVNPQCVALSDRGQERRDPLGRTAL